MLIYIIQSVIIFIILISLVIAVASTSMSTNKKVEQQKTQLQNTELHLVEFDTRIKNSTKEIKDNVLLLSNKLNDMSNNQKKFDLNLKSIKPINIISVMNSVKGPLPLNTTFTTNGGVVCLFIYGSLLATNPNVVKVGFDVLINSINKGSILSSLNPVNQHTQLNGCVIVKDLEANTHKLTLKLAEGSVNTDTSDFFSVTLIEFPTTDNSVDI